MSPLRLGLALLVSATAILASACGGDDTSTGSGAGGGTTSSGGAGGTTDTSTGGGTTSSGGAGGAGGTTDTSSGGAGGAGGAGGSTTSTTTVETCEPGTFDPCYSGPEGTLGVGTCAEGYRTCLPSGTYGPCEGETLPLTEVCSTIEDEDCTGSNDPCTGPGSAEWIRVWGGPDPSRSIGVHALRTDPQGNILVLGSASGAADPIDFGDGFLVNTSSYLATFDEAGTTTAVTEWDYTGGALLDPGPASVLVSSKHVAGLLSIASTIPADVYERSFDGALLDQWHVADAYDNGGSPDTCYAFMYETSLRESPHDLTVTGLVRGNVDLAGTTLSKDGFAHDIVVARLLDQGAPAFVEHVSVNSAREVSHALLPDGDIALLAYGYGPFTYQGATITTSTVGYLLARIDGATGALVWSKWFEMSALGVGHCRLARERVVVLPDGSIAVWLRSLIGVKIEGTTYDGIMGFARFDGDGNALWVRAVPNAIDEYPEVYGGSIIATDDGGVAWAATVNGILDYGGGALGAWSFGNDAKPIVVKLDASTGAFEWGHMLQTSQSQLTGLAALPGGAVVLAGQFKDTLSVSGKQVTAPSQTSGWLMKLLP